MVGRSHGVTVIAWDGKTLAADKRACNNGLARTTTKIHRVGDVLVAFSGDAAQGREMLAWVTAGRQVADFPASQRDENKWATLIVVDEHGLSVYEQTPYPIPFEDGYFASGSGRDFALAAMHCGKTAAEAVEVACFFQVDCGNGIDVLELIEQAN